MRKLIKRIGTGTRRGVERLVSWFRREPPVPVEVHKTPGVTVVKPYVPKEEDPVVPPPTGGARRKTTKRAKRKPRKRGRRE